MLAPMTRLRDTLRRLVRSAEGDAPDVETPEVRSRLLIVALVGIPILIDAIWLLPELTSGALNLNDDAFHYLMAQRAADAIGNGLNPLDFWMPQLELGFPQFLYYQNLPHLAVVGLQAILSGAVDLFTTFNLLRYLLLVGFPLTVFWSMRRMGFSMVASGIAAASSSLLSGDFRYGFEYDSYLHRGFGMYTQLWAMHLSFISLACVWRVLQRGNGYLPAILALTALGLSHLIYAYMMVITLAIVGLVFLRRGTMLATLLRLATLGGVVALTTAWMWLPFLGSYQYLSASPYLQSYKYDSFGAPAILGWLFSGDLLDHGRLPVLTVLLGLGVGAALVRRSRLGLIALSGFLVWLVLYFGRPTLGFLADLFPLHEGLLFHRFVGEMDIFAIVLMGVGGAALWRIIARLSAPRLRLELRPVVALGVVLLALVPAASERIAFDAQNTIWMQQTADAFHGDTDLQSILGTLAAQPPGGRTYAGLRTNWGGQMTVGQARVTDALTFEAIPAVSPPYQGLSLNSDLIWDFRDDDPGQFDLLDVRYVIAPTGRAIPVFYTPMQVTARYTLYRVQTSGAAEYVTIVARRQAPTQRALFDANLAWFKGPDPDAHDFIRWDYEAPAGPPVTSAACPGGGKTDFEYQEAEAIHLVVECPAAATLAIKVTYHPNWHVRVDGRPVETFMVSPSFVGVDLPAGKHTVDAVYEATPSKTPLLLLGVAVLGLAAVFRRRLDWLARRFEGPSSGVHHDVAGPHGEEMPSESSPGDRARIDGAIDARPLRSSIGTVRIGSVFDRFRQTLQQPLDTTLLLAAALVAVFMLHAWDSGHVRTDLLLWTGVSTDRAHQADFYQLWAVGGLTVSHPDIYSMSARQDLGRLMQAKAQVAGTSTRELQASRYWPVAQTTGTPFIYALFGVAQTGDFEIDSTLFAALSLIAFAGSLFWLCRRLRFGTGRSLLVVAVVVATSEPLYMDLGWGNVNSLQVAMLIGYLALRSGRPSQRRQITAGALLGLAVLVKPNLALVVPLLAFEIILSRRWRDGAMQATGLAIAGLAALLITAMRFGSLDEWAAWLGAVSTLTPLYATPGYSVPATILALVGLPDQAAGTVVLLSVVLLLVAIGSSLAIVAWSRPLRTPLSLAGDERRWAREATILGIAVVITLLASPFVWNHYFLLLTPLVVLLLRRGRGEAGETRLVGFRQLAAIAALFLMSAAPAMVSAAQWDPVPYLVCLALAAIILLAAALVELSAGGTQARRTAGQIG
jgi:hypothetical protein